jgi:type VI secretion system FHA domain protein
VDPILTVRLENTGEIRRLAAGTLSVGRDLRNNWVIGTSGSNSVVSRQHATLAAEPDGFTVTDHGSTNGTLLNGRRMAPHAASPLRQGDVIEIAGFRFLVTIETAQVAPVEVSPVFAPSPAEPILAMPAPPRQAEDAATPLFESLLEGLVRDNGGRPAIDRAPAAELSRHDPQQAFGALFEAEPAGPEPAQLEQRPSGPPQQEALLPRPRPAVDPRNDSVDSLLAAFLQGAGLAAGEAVVSDPHAFLANAGAVFAAMADGLRQLLAVRTQIKADARLSPTLIGAEANNPLKHSIDWREAVLGLLRSRGPGYLDPHRAVTNAIQDLSAHEIALLDAFQAALTELLDTFDPARLETRLSDAGALPLLIQGGRRASLWDLYVARYREVASSARRQSIGIFDDTFRTTYANRSRLAGALGARRAGDAP